MFAKKNLALVAVCGLLSSVGLLAQANQQELVAALQSKDWRARNAAARSLLPLADELSAEAKDALWQVALPAWGLFEQPKYPSFDDVYHGTGRSHLQALGYHPFRGVCVPTDAHDLSMPHSGQTLALMLLLRSSHLDPERWKRCLAAALHESDVTAATMLAELWAKFGQSALDEVVKRIAAAADQEASPKTLVALLRLLPAFGKPGWDHLRVMATDPQYDTLRRASLRVIGVTDRPAEWDLFAAKRLLDDDECEGELCGLLAVRTVAPEDPAAVQFLFSQFDECGAYNQLSILAVIGQGRFVGRAHDVATSIVEAALDSDDDDVLQLALGWARRRGRVALTKEAEQRLLALATSSHDQKKRAASALWSLAVRNHDLRDRAVTAGAIPGSRLRRLFVDDNPPWFVGDRLADEFGNAVAAAKPSERVRVAIELAKTPWQARLPAMRAALQKELQSGDARRVRAALDVIVPHSQVMGEPIGTVRQLTESEDRGIRRAGFRALVRLEPAELPAAIEAGHVDGEWPASVFAKQVPRARLVVLLEHEDATVREAAARFLGMDSGASAEQLAALLHENRRVRLNVWQTSNSMRHLTPTQLADAAAKWRETLADGAADWALRMDAARYLMNRQALTIADVETLLTADGRLKQGEVPQEWNSSVGGAPIESYYPPPTRWELFTAVESIAHTPAITAWLQKHADKSRNREFTSRCKELLLREIRRARIAKTAEAWFAGDEKARTELKVPDYSYSRADARALVPTLFTALQKAAQKNGRDTLPEPHADSSVKPSTVKVGDYEFPYVFLAKGDKPATGWPLYICLHGGGGNGKAKGPHSWRVNTREWRAQKMLFDRVYKPGGLYFIPRMADDRRGRWWHDHNQIAFEQVIEQAILFRDVDPNRVYLMGISEGGYGAIRFAGNCPDRFAATGGMAAAEPMRTSPPENMRNVAMRIDIGEKDTMFDRVGLARRMGERLAELRAADPDGYDYAVNVQAGRGHGIDYSLTPQWLAERVRNPRPKRVVWTVQKFDSRVAQQHYWVRLGAKPDDLPWFIEARFDRGDLIVTVERPSANGGREPVTSGSLVILLDDRLASLDYNIDIVVNGKALPPIRVQRSLEVMLRTMAERCDPESCFCAEVLIDLAGPTAR